MRINLDLLSKTFLNLGRQCYVINTPSLASRSARQKGLPYEWCRPPDVGLPAPDLVVFLDITPEKVVTHLLFFRLDNKLDNKFKYVRRFKKFKYFRRLKKIKYFRKLKKKYIKKVACGQFILILIININIIIIKDQDLFYKIRLLKEN